MNDEIDSVSSEVDCLAEEIRNKVMATHLNLRVVFETVEPSLESARLAARCSNPEGRAIARRVLTALREFSRSL